MPQSRKSFTKPTQLAFVLEHISVVTTYLITKQRNISRLRTRFCPPVSHFEYTPY